MKKRNYTLVLALAGLITASLCSTLHAAEEPVQDMQTFPSYLDVGYDQKHRPQFHFTSRKNWLNDPNGMVYYDGEYHSFFSITQRPINGAI